MPDIDKVTAWVDKMLPTDNDRKCYQCEKVVSREDAIKGLADGEIKVQSFTGRLYCCDDCWHEYLQNEGLEPRDDDDEYEEDE